MRLGDIELSITPATRTAMSVLTRYASPAMRNHAIRSGLWAAAFAQITHLAHDPELLQVAAMLHDLSLEAPFDSHRLPFEQASGHVAIVFAAGAGWPPARADRLALAIEQHMADDVDGLEPEGYLLQRATSLDISGRDVARYPQTWSPRWLPPCHASTWWRSSRTVSRTKPGARRAHPRRLRFAPVCSHGWRPTHSSVSDQPTSRSRTPPQPVARLVSWSA